MDRCGSAGSPKRFCKSPDCSLTGFIPEAEVAEVAEVDTRAMKASESPTLTGCSVELIWATGTGT